MRLNKGMTITLLPCIVLFVLVPSVINGEKAKEDIGERIAILYPDDVDLSVKILAKYIDLKHILPYYALLAQQEEFEAARRRLESAEEAALYAKRDLDESLRGRPVIAAGVIESHEEKPSSPKNKPTVQAPNPTPEARPAVFPDRTPPRQITIYPYRLEEAAPVIAQYFTKEELIKYWPK